MPNLIAQIALAAFLACSTLFLEGGARMNLGARTALWSDGAKLPTARDYVQDGLIAMWDGIENAGWGTHDANATVWKDLIGGVGDLTIPSAGLFDENSFSGTGINAATLGRAFSDFAVVQFCVRGTVTASERTKRLSILSTGSTSRFVWFYGPAGRFSTSLGGRYYQPSYPIDMTGTYSVDYSNAVSYYNGNVMEKVVGESIPLNNEFAIGRSSNQSYDQSPIQQIFNLRLYSHSLTAAEIAANYAIDKARFGLT